MFKRRLKKRLNSEFGASPDIMYFPGDMEHIRAYYDFRRENKTDEFLIDDITWNDLNLDSIFKRINPGLSTSGEQYLYYELRSPAIDSAAYTKRKSLIDLMSSSPQLRLKLQVILARLGRSRRADLSRAFHPSEHGHMWLCVYLALVLLIPAAAIYAAFNGTYWMIAFIIIFNAYIHEHRRKKCAGDFDTVNYTVSMIFALHKMQKLRSEELDSHMEVSYKNLHKLKPIIRVGGISTVSDGSLGDVASTLFLIDLIVYEFLKNRLSRCHAEVFAVHEALGQIDAAIAVASYRKSLEHFSVPDIDFTAGAPYICASGMTHPLLNNAVPNDLCTRRPILITGSNASGKSTYLKTSALCALLSQSICTAPAASYRASAFRIYSSMALADNIFSGESYYIVETKSLKRILDRVDGAVPLLCTIDEVLRGTNTVERIAASSKILEVLSARGALCLAATHDIELCELLSQQYELYHFEEQIGDDGMEFDYKIRCGKAVSRNAINLLKLMGFDDNIVSGAHERANAYMESGVWM